MTYWRKFFIVVLLALSLPAQLFAVGSMKCAIADAAQAPLGYAGHDRFADEPASYGALAWAADHDRRPCEICHPHACSTCASCCVAIALPADPSLAISPDATRVIARILPSVDVVSFLTDGIERPPRYAPN